MTCGDDQMHDIKLRFFFLACIPFLVTISFLDAQIIKPKVIADSGYYPAMAMDKNGNIHVVWQQNGCMYAVFDSMWNSIRQPYRISQSTDMLGPSIGTGPNSLFAAFEDVSPLIIFNTSIIGQLLSLAGDMLGENELMNDQFFDAGRSKSKVILLRDSTYFVVWAGNGPQTPGYSAIYGQIIEGRFKKNHRFDTDSTLVRDGPNIFLSDTLFNNGKGGGPEIATHLQSNTIVVTYLNDPNNKNKLLGRLFTKDGFPLGNAFVISDTISTHLIYAHAVVMKNSGEFVAVWSDEADSVGVNANIYSRVYDVNGLSKTSIKRINTNVALSSLKVAAGIDYDDRYLVIWNDSRTWKLVAQRFDSNDLTIGENFYIADSTQYPLGSQSVPCLLLRNSRIYTVWSGFVSSIYKLYANVLDFDHPVSEADESKGFTPHSFVLFQNYPNPFNPQTMIKFGLPNDGVVTLKVYNTTGQDVYTLVNQWKTAGFYQVEFDASRLSSGVYYYKLISGNFSDIKKMVIIK